MDGLERTAGVGSMITLGGQQLQVQCRILEHHAAISAEIFKSRGNPFDMIRQAKESLGDDKELVAQIVTRIMYESRDWRDCTIAEIGQWIADTWAGQCYATWLSVRENDPNVLTLDEVTKRLSREMELRTKRDGAEAAGQWLDEINTAIDRANGEDEMGNSTGSLKSEDSGEPDKSEDESLGTTST